MTDTTKDPLENENEGPADGGAAGVPGVQDGGADGGGARTPCRACTGGLPQRVVPTSMRTMAASRSRSARA